MGTRCPQDGLGLEVQATITRFSLALFFCLLSWSEAVFRLLSPLAPQDFQRRMMTHSATQREAAENRDQSD